MADNPTDLRVMAGDLGALIEDLEAVLDGFPRHPSWPGQGRKLLAAYLDVLVDHRDVAAWLDTHHGALSHRTRRRFADANQRLRDAIRGDNRSAAARLGAAAVLGTLWRPLRQLEHVPTEVEREALLDAAMAVVTSVRSS